MPPDLDREWLTRRSSIDGRHGRLYGEQGFAGERVAVWVWDETLTIEYAAETLAQYPVAFEADRRLLREVGEPQLVATGHASPQPFLPDLRETDWRPAQRLAPYRPRRRHRQNCPQARLFEAEEGDAAG